MQNASNRSPSRFRMKLLCTGLAACTTSTLSASPISTTDGMTFGAISDKWYPNRPVVSLDETHDAKIFRPQTGMPGNAHPLIACNETSLRIAAASAMNGDVIDMTACVGSVITLTQGAVHVFVDDLTLIGPGPDLMTIDGGASTGYNDKVFVHTGHGRLWLEGMTITDAHYIGQYAANGGCIYSSGSIRLSQSVVSGCTVDAPSTSNAYALGGAVFASMDVTLEYSTISNSIAYSSHNGAYGGGVFARGTFLGAYSTVANNLAIAPAGYSYGGGVEVFGYGDLTLNNSTLFGNAARIAGAVGARTSGASLVASSTISYNYASEYVGGGSFSAGLTVANSTITNNAASYSTYGIGLNVFQTLTAKSSIIANNGNSFGIFDVSTSAIDGVADIITAASSVPPNTISACPRLTRLQDNGGPTLTMAPIGEGPEIDFGADLGLVTDQRGSGYPRVFGDWADIGAVEWEGAIGDEIFKSAFEARCDDY